MAFSHLIFIANWFNARFRCQQFGKNHLPEESTIISHITPTAYPTTNLFVFFKNFAGIGRSRCHVIFIGLDP